MSKHIKRITWNMQYFFYMYGAFLFMYSLLSSSHFGPSVDSRTIIWNQSFFDMLMILSSIFLFTYFKNNLITYIDHGLSRKQYFKDMLIGSMCSSFIMMITKVIILLIIMIRYPLLDGVKDIQLWVVALNYFLLRFMIMIVWLFVVTLGLNFRKYRSRYFNAGFVGYLLFLLTRYLGFDITQELANVLGGDVYQNFIINFSIINILLIIIITLMMLIFINNRITNYESLPLDIVKRGYSR